jgi:hypothetical protein
VQWILRIGVSLTFLGHGSFAILHKPIWFSYLAFVGFPEHLQAELMSIIGVLDIAVAIGILFRPYRVLLIWAFIWTFITALIRPLSGESWLEFVERGANWSAPLALLILSKNHTLNRKE